MLNTILSNLTLIGCAMIILSIFMGSNIGFSLWYNIGTVGQMFNKTKLLKGIGKLFVFVLGLALLAIGVTLLPYYIALAGIELDTTITQAFNVLAITLVFVQASIKYGKEAFDTFKNIVDGKK